ncbi:Acyl-coenzyme A synthetase ACSM3, mitochondrial [Lamellibrachia satsuma]|nr:Acyl-coenzyme A synthetase ACSM3, mitochondrial [Lamellibrachia satsuma]
MTAVMIHVDRTSNILSGPCQLTPGDRVVVILPRVPEWWLLNIASCRMGVVLIPGTTQLTARDIRHRLLRSGAKCVIIDATTANNVDQVIGDCPNVQTKLVVGNSANPRYGWLDFVQLFNAVKPRNKQVQTKSDDPLQIFGTTGEPKMTQQTHSSYGLASLITGKYWLDLTPSDVHWNLSDTGWAKSACSSVFGPWTQGACVFVHHSPKFTPQRVLEVLEKYPISTFCAAPTAYRMLVLENFAKYNLSSICHCVSSGEPLVESALLEHPAVVESAVVSSPHATRGEVVKAYVVLRTDYQNADKEALTSELQQLVKDVTAPYKYPSEIEFVESLPKTISGKIRRVDLRSREWRKQQRLDDI